MKKTVDTFFDQLELGDCRQHDTATIFPLFSGIEPVVEYLTLSEAYSQEAISVRETSESGSVPELLVINRADQPVLILRKSLAPSRTAPSTPLSCSRKNPRPSSRSAAPSRVAGPTAGTGNPVNPLK